MKKIIFFSLTLQLICLSVFGQTNVRGWYAQGQVWIIWQKTGIDSLTYAIYSKPTIFLSTNTASLTGRMFQYEWSGYDLQYNASDSNVRQRIPIPNDTAHYTLLPDEGLFVETVTLTGSKFYGVVKYGDTLVTNSNRVFVNYNYDINDPPMCHHQYTGISMSGYTFKIYSMWADGRDDHNGGRPDFPVMGNRHKNGVPHIFIISEPLAGLPGDKVPAVAFLHGGDGSARQSIAESRREINITPIDGLLIAHNDRFYRIDSTTDNRNSWFFGYYKNYDPFSLPAMPLNDTVINYTQRRIIWIHDWLVKYRNVDSNRISLMGHSVGSSGTVQLMKAYPNKFSSTCIFNNGLEGPRGINPIFGDKLTNSPTNLINFNSITVRFGEIFDLVTNISQTRDLPVSRIFNGKMDINQTMGWDSLVVDNYKKSDSAGFGTHLYWDGRGHGLNQWLGSHWANSIISTDQTQRDDGFYQSRYSKNQSFPAFYNHEGRPGNNDPGNGLPANGDLRGTWGGYHDWDTNLVDTEGKWEATCYLTGNYLNPVDSCPLQNLTSDVAIRRPQNFLPPAGSLVYWRVVNTATGDTLQQGSSIVDSNGVARADDITLSRYPNKAKLIFFYPQGITTLNLRIIPQGFYDQATNLLQIRDSVSVILKDAITLASVDSARGVLDSVLLGNQFKFTNAPSGSYYIVIRHRNSIETWSKTGGELLTSGSINTFDFTDNQNKAFGSNMKQVDTSPLRYGIYSGDENQDGFVNLTDVVNVYNNANAFVNGYVASDMNGDNITDLTDVVITFNNANSFVAKITP